MADDAQFSSLLESLLSIDNDVRSQAEEAYNNLTIELKVTLLLRAIQNAQVDEDRKSIASVLLRRVFSSEFQDFFPKLPVDAQTELKQQILLLLQQETSPNLKRKICEVVAEVARNLIDDDGNNQWPEVLQLLFQCANATNVQLQESALRIFASVPGIFGNQQNNYLQIIKEMLLKYLDPSSNRDVRFQAVRAVVAFILLHDKEVEIQKYFSDLLPHVIMITADSIKEEDDQTLIKLLIEMAESVPKFLRPQLEAIFEVCINVFNSPDVEDTWRHLALEVMVSLSENAAPMVRKKAEKYIAALVPLVLKMMTELEDEDDWAVSDEINDEDSGENNVIAESALDRLACGLGGKAILPHIASNIPNMLNNADWKYRHAALMAISAAGEGCHKQMEAILDSIMQGVLKYLMDPHPRVRYAACNAIGQMASDFAPTFEKKYHEQVIPGLLTLLDDVANPRVQAHAGAALVNFSEDCPKSILTRYLDSIMTKLEAILTKKINELVEQGTKLVLEQVVTTIASVADTTGKEFVVYYDRLMPCLKYMILNANTEELKMLRGKTIECVSLIGLAVGAEKFMSDASEVMEMLLKTHSEGNLPDDDPQTTYLISAWARICKILGKQFEQYLPLVMGPVMKTAAMKPEVAVLDNDEIQDVESDPDWQFVNLSDQQNFGIRTAGLEDKAAACEMLVCYARELKEGFANYAEEVVRLMVPLFKFYFHDGVRRAAAESLPVLLICAKIKGPQYLENMWAYICPELLKAIDTEPESEVIAELLQSLAKCIETLGANCLSQEAMEEVIKIVNRFMNEHFVNADKRIQARNEEDYDEAVEEQLAEEDETDVYLLAKIADILHSLFMTQKNAFLPYFEQIAPHFVKLLDPSRPSWADRQWGICIFDDLIEFCGPACAQYQTCFLQLMIQYCKDKQPEVRQAAIYGCGILAQCGGDQFAQTFSIVMPILIEAILASNAREPENMTVTENAISAVAKILKYNSTAITNPDEIVNVWFQSLPVTEDDEEAPHIYGYLCDLIQSNHPIILGNNNSNLPRIVALIGDAFYHGVIQIITPTNENIDNMRMDYVQRNNEVAGRLLNIVKQIQGNPEVFNACIQFINDQQKAALDEAMKSFANITVA
ncbi:CLUMA_CG012554, isoform A [Clunio marinus]|uniref:CLUMA_CG012554, isoform A n=1 Tax=Clunio marinus TaxID=568069 RepID=A0A1J1IJZ7_9DIPT|nr:CLUMA_CG012554, isoform A [Clunio marinus]